LFLLFGGRGGREETLGINSMVLSTLTMCWGSIIAPI